MIKFILSVILWIVVAGFFIWLGKKIWKEDKDDFDNFAV